MFSAVKIFDEFSVSFCNSPAILCNLQFLALIFFTAFTAIFTFFAIFSVDTSTRGAKVLVTEPFALNV